MEATVSETLKPKRQQAAKTGEQRLLDYAAGSRYLGIGYWAFGQLVLGGTWPCVRIGKRVLSDKRDLDQWIESQKASNI